MASCGNALQYALKRYINNFDSIEGLRGLLQTTSVDIRYSLLKRIRGNSDRTGVHKSAQLNDLDTLEYALDGFSSIQRYDITAIQAHDGSTALQFAAYAGHSAVVSYLLEGLSLQQRYNLLKIQDKNGYTPLHDTATEKKTNVFQVIINSVPIVKQFELLNMKNHAGKTPMQLFEHSPLLNNIGNFIKLHAYCLHLSLLQLLKKHQGNQLGRSAFSAFKFANYKLIHLILLHCHRLLSRLIYYIVIDMCLDSFITLPLIFI